MDSLVLHNSEGNVATLSALEASPTNESHGMWIGGTPEPLVDRRSYAGNVPGVERRQFSNSYEGLSPAAVELAQTIDRYKMSNRRRFITYEEILEVITSLGYSKK